MRRISWPGENTPPVETAALSPGPNQKLFKTSDQQQVMSENNLGKDTSGTSLRLAMGARGKLFGIWAASQGTASPPAAGKCLRPRVACLDGKGAGRWQGTALPAAKRGCLRELRESDVSSSVSPKQQSEVINTITLPFPS